MAQQRDGMRRDAENDLPERASRPPGTPAHVLRWRPSFARRSALISGSLFPSPPTCSPCSAPIRHLACQPTMHVYEMHVSMIYRNEGQCYAQNPHLITDAKIMGINQHRDQQQSFHPFQNPGWSGDRTDTTLSPRSASLVPSNGQVPSPSARSIHAE
ncbi:hypothetical protein VTN00DRAFT_5130 [Thermoascus crustaceus]|uniref:uncharacterized protein n=1 Tax=Thermoascus crustaceus TaxID=5088 RepID=UPI003742102D